MLPLCKKRLPGALGPFLFTDYIYIVKTGIFSQVSWSQVLNPWGGKEWDAAPLRVNPKIFAAMPGVKKKVYSHCPAVL